MAKVGPKCVNDHKSVTATQDWWTNTVFYQIYPLSYQDASGNGSGDLKGITERLVHLKDAGIQAAWLSPIFESPLADFGYDISDYRAIQKQFGTMADFDDLIVKVKELDIKLILDFVPNHTSDQHEWFVESMKGTEQYKDYYVWKDGITNENGERQPPNNWISVFGGPAWTYVESRGKYYLHQFLKEQPDLNYRNPKVVQEMKDVMTFWMDRGVAGFRVDAVPFLFEDAELRDEPLSHDPKAFPTDYAYLTHPYTTNLPETYDMVYQWRAHLDEYSAKTDNMTRVMMTEAYADIKQQMLYYGSGDRLGAHFTFNFLLLTDLNRNSTAHDFMFTINKWISYMPLQCTANWVLGNHDNRRVASRYGPERADGLNMLAMLLPGVAVTYYGEEIAMEDTFVSFSETKDPQGLNVGPDRFEDFTRDPERTPMQWDDSPNAGFSNGSTTWLPVNANYKQLNVARQKQTEDSHFRIYQELIQLRDSATLRMGELRIKALSENLFSLVRELKDEPTYIFVFNLGKESVTVDLSPYRLAMQSAEVVIASGSATLKKGMTLDGNSFQIGSYEAYVLRMDA